MADDQTNRPGPPGVRGYLEHAAFRAGQSESGIGSAVVRSSFERGMHRWDCIVSDGSQHHYIFLSSAVGARPNISAFDVEDGVERFAGTIAAGERLRVLGNSSPLQIDREGRVSR